jgi:pimeloyl-ACP methyl ester carboxylesterase
MPTIEIRGVNLRYEIVGDDGPLVTLITGGRRGYDEFLPMAQKLSAEGYRVLLHDRRNTGASDILMSADEVEEAVWADDLHALLSELGEVPAFIGGSSSGARTALFFALRHRDAARGLLLLRVTGGAFAAGRLPEAYYDQFIRAAQAGGMEAVCATPEYGERIAANPKNQKRLMDMSSEAFIDIQTRLRNLFMAGSELPVFGVSETELGSLATPTVIVPGNDRVHDSRVGQKVHAMIPGSELHMLPIEDSDEPVIPFTEWSDLEPEIVSVFSNFMRRHDASGVSA